MGCAGAATSSEVPTVPTSTTAGAKICCECGADVTHARRMKDHQGRYWCVPCGEADQKRQRRDANGICFGCGESFVGIQLFEIAHQRFCGRCLKLRREKELSGFAGFFANIK